MNDERTSNRKHPWRDALIATTGLSVFSFASSQLWTSGYPEWAFALAFVAIWLLLTVSWSNIRFTEESGSILARIVDHNFDHVNERIERLELELVAVRGLSANVTPHLSPATEHGRERNAA